MLRGGLEHCCACFGGGVGVCVLLCERQPATGASSSRRGTPCAVAARLLLLCVDLLADGALLGRPAADLRPAFYFCFPLGDGVK